MSYAPADVLWRYSFRCFVGKGGIGKTVTSAALLRDDAVRKHYDQILFLPLGQTPVMEKVRSMMFLQLTGVELKVDWSEAEKLEELRKATSGRRLLLCKPILFPF